ncbi:tRNA (adenosine(37)-N6)-dimethylallyltransferase MiaA [Mycoplasmatota bacterium]|nr:tRNA (adenosine(37)-N6)-dimethylallyltransferase MiaA [Mycoplasmatota bacterium]
MDLIVIVGPTAVGKTKLSIELAKKINGEIISGDAMQFYMGLDIGTAKASENEQAEVKHHLLDILEADQSFSVVDYQREVRKKIKEIKDKNKTPILVGGSGLYVQAIIEDYHFKGKKRSNDHRFEDMDLLTLQNKLKLKNPHLFALTDIQNKRRVIRALEKEDSDIQKENKAYYEDYYIIGLNTDREKLYERINDRVDLMIKNGLIDEVKSLYQKKIVGQSIKAIGYKELYQYFDGLITLEEAIRLIKRNSRRYAKRQLTWFRNKMTVHWFESHIHDFDLTINEVMKVIKKKLNK